MVVDAILGCLIVVVFGIIASLHGKTKRLLVFQENQKKAIRRINQMSVDSNQKLHKYINTTQANSDDVLKIKLNLNVLNAHKLEINQEQKTLRNSIRFNTKTGAANAASILQTRAELGSRFGLSIEEVLNYKDISDKIRDRNSRFAQMESHLLDSIFEDPDGKELVKLLSQSEVTKGV